MSWEGGMRNIKKSQKMKERNLQVQDTWLSFLFLNTVIDKNSRTRYLLFEQDKKKYPLEEFRRAKYAHTI